MLWFTRLNQTGLQYDVALNSGALLWKGNKSLVHAVRTCANLHWNSRNSDSSVKCHVYFPCTCIIYPFTETPPIHYMYFCLSDVPEPICSQRFERDKTKIMVVQLVCVHRIKYPFRKYVMVFSSVFVSGRHHSVWKTLVRSFSTWLYYFLTPYFRHTRTSRICGSDNCMEKFHAHADSIYQAFLWKRAWVRGYSMSVNLIMLRIYLWIVYGTHLVQVSKLPVIHISGSLQWWLFCHYNISVLARNLL